MKQALLIIDFINEIVDEKGKLAGKGYAAFIEKSDTFEKVNLVIEEFRKKGLPLVFVNLAFDQAYSNQPKGSPLFGRAHEFGILQRGTWSTQVHAAVDRREDDLIMVKTRVSAFYNTGLTQVLHNLGVTDLFIIGVATDLAVEASARDAHDRDFKVTVITDACAAANEDDHKNSLRTLSKIAALVNVAELNLHGNTPL